MNDIKSFIHTVDMKCSCNQGIRSRVDSNSSEIILTLRALSNSDTAILEHLPKGASLLKLTLSEHASVVISSPCRINHFIRSRHTYSHQNESILSFRLSELLSTNN